MSIANAWLTPERVILATDTEVVNAAGAPIATTGKVALLAHLPAALMGRGTCGLLHFCALTAQTSGLDFDGLAGQMQSLVLPVNLEALEEVFAQKGLPAPQEAQSIVLVGWSGAQKRMLGWYYEQKTKSEGFSAEAITESHISPWDESLAGFPDPVDVRTMQYLAAAQVRLFEEKAPEAAGGGELIIATLTERDVRIQRCGKLVRLRPGGNATARDPVPLNPRGRMVWRARRLRHDGWNRHK